MSFGIFNQDSSFFTVSSPDVNISNTVLGEDVISLSFNEQFDRLDEGNLKMVDPEGVYARILRIGVTLDISWGYNRPDLETAAAIRGETGDSITQQVLQRSVRGYIQSPSGGGDEGGVRTFNCRFIQLEGRGTGNNRRRWEKGTKRQVIQEAMTDLGVSDIFIQFEQAGDQITPDTIVYQWEPTFRFLVRKAVEWRCVFKVGYKQNGQTVGIFVNPEIATDADFLFKQTGIRQSANYFDYRGPVSNVISYEWKNNQGDSGIGAGAQLQFANGEIRIQRYVVEQDKVKTWKLNETKLDTYLERIEVEQGQRAKFDVYLDFLQARDFEEVQRFFDPVESETAPQGFGYTVNLQTVGNPLVTVSNRCNFGEGFPDFIGNAEGLSGRPIIWYIRSVNHNISRSGYKCQIEVVDDSELNRVQQGLGRL